MTTQPSIEFNSSFLRHRYQAEIHSNSLGHLHIAIEVQGETEADRAASAQQLRRYIEFVLSPQFNQAMGFLLLTEHPLLKLEASLEAALLSNNPKQLEDALKATHYALTNSLRDPLHNQLISEFEASLTSLKEAYRALLGL